QQRQVAVRQKEEAETQWQRAEREKSEKEKQRQEAETQKAKAEAETRRVKSALKTAQLLRVEMVGASNPQAGFYLLRDEEVFPTAERDFAWGLYNRWCLRKDLQQDLERATLKGQSDVTCVAISPDGKTLASGSAKHTIKLWDAASGQERATLTG